MASSVLSLLNDKEIQTLQTCKKSRRFVNNLITTGRMGRDEVVALAHELDWVIVKDFTESISIMHKDGQYLRAYFCEKPAWLMRDPDLRSERSKVPKERWIYGLLAHADDGSKACYIGQTANLKKRLRHHADSQKEATSFYLKQWAETMKCQIHVVLLAHAHISEPKCRVLEGYWLQLAMKAGYLTPAVERWGNLPKVPEYPSMPLIWPALAIEKIAQSLRLMTEQSNEHYQTWANKALFNLESVDPREPLDLRQT